MMNLTAYIEQIGDEAAAKLFSEKLRTVKAWRRRERKPRPKCVPKLIERSAGVLTYENIYQVGDSQ